MASEDRESDMKRYYTVKIKVISRLGTKPVVKTIGYDTVFCWLGEGMTATYTTKRKHVNRKHRTAHQKKG